MKRWLSCALAPVVAVVFAAQAQAGCVERGIWHKEVYCTPDPGEDVYLPPALNPLPTIDEQVAALLNDAREQIKANNLLGAWTQTETARRLKNDDQAAIALQNELIGLIAAQERRAQEERLNARIFAILREARELAGSGNLQAAYEKAKAASALNAANREAYDLTLRYRSEIEAKARAGREQRAAANRAAYEEALKRAAQHTREALDGLAQRLQGKSWAHAETALFASRQATESPADSEQDLLNDRGQLQIGFDHLDNVLSGPALERLGAGPRAVPVAAASREERIGRLIDQIDYLEGLRRKIDEAIKAEVDTAKQDKLRAQLATVKAIKATARAKLMDYSIKGTTKP